MDEEKVNTLTFSKAKYGPLVDHSFAGLQLGNSIRHNPDHSIVEPKVFSPYKSRLGQVPRPIEVERKKRKYASIDLNQLLLANGVLESLAEFLTKSKQNDTALDNLSLSLFDNSDYHSRTLEQWIDYIGDSALEGGLPARAFAFFTVRGGIQVAWKKCHVIDTDSQKKGNFIVEYDKSGEIDDGLSISSKNNAGDNNSVTSLNSASPASPSLESVYICFDSEDPILYAKRLEEAVALKKRTIASMVL
jgi:dynein heavy chain